MSRQPKLSPAPLYAELQAISNFSFLRGGSHPHELVAQAKALGLAALAVADHNTLSGVVRAHTAAKEVGLRLIVGARLDLEDAPSVVCLPTDRRAYGRLSRLLSLGQGRAVKGQCHLALADLAAHAEGQILIVLPPEDWTWRHDTLAAPLHRLRNALPGVRLHLAAAHTLRGNDRARINALAALARRTGIPLVATGDVLFHAPQRRPLTDVLAAIRLGVPVAEAGLALTRNGERHLKSPAEMARLFRGHETALAATVDIMAACRFSLDELRYEYPDEPIPPGTSAQSHLAAITREGARERFPEGVPGKVAATLERELALIAELDYAPYFLTVHDIVAFARSRQILAQGRGSAANSVVCYCLGITAVDPTEVDLLFERFISAERREPPDIDVDFEHERREEVIQYIYARYGRDRAGLAATVICYRARSAVREVGRAMGLSEDIVAALAGMVWGTRSGGALPEAHVREAGLDPADPLLAAVLDLADELIGFPRHLSQHVGGFVLARSALVEIVPVGNGAMPNRTFIEWDKDDLAALGLMKVDVLALGMLSCIRRAFDLLAQHSNLPLTLASVPRDDTPTYDMLCRADSIGVFQVESRAQMNMLPRLKPRTFYDLVIEVAIVRPGPIQGDMVHPYLRRRSGAEPETYPSPDPAHGTPDELRQILGKTKGVPLFQEQAMRIAMVAARFSDAEVNELRKSMATFRRRGTIGQLEEKMIARMVARGYPAAFATRCFNQIKGFGEYGFPESHAASFAHLVYVSSWLKCHHPAAFACALLNAQPMGFYAPAQIVRDAREHGVEVRAADVNHSHWDSTLELAFSGPSVASCPRALVPRDQQPGTGHLALRLGLRQIDGLAEAEAAKLVTARDLMTAKELMTAKDMGSGTKDLGSGPRQQETGNRDETTRTRDEEQDATTVEPSSLSSDPWPLVPGPFFRNLHDLRQRAGLRRDTIERLAAADALRSLDLDRRQGLWEAKALGQAAPLPLFAWGNVRETGAEPVVVLPAMPLSEHVVNDYQTQRLSLKAHPMQFLRPALAAERVATCHDLKDGRDGARVTVAGVILVRQRPGSAKGVVFMTIEDETGVANAVIWPKTLERFRRVVMAARLVVIQGRIQRHEAIIHVVAARLEDRSAWLERLADGGVNDPMPIPIANADEVLRPDPGSARSQVTPSLRHPRAARIVPRSRDFH